MGHNRAGDNRKRRLRRNKSDSERIAIKILKRIYRLQHPLIAGKEYLLPISTLAYSGRSWRVFNQRQFNLLVASIREFGQVTPVRILGDYRVVDGRRIISAMRHLGFEEVRVKVYTSTNLLEESLKLISG